MEESLWEKFEGSVLDKVLERLSYIEMNDLEFR